MRSVEARCSAYAACILLTAVVARTLTAGGATDPGGDPDGATLEAVPVVLAVVTMCLLVAVIELGRLLAGHRRCSGDLGEDDESAPNR